MTEPTLTTPAKANPNVDTETLGVMYDGGTKVEAISDYATDVTPDGPPKRPAPASESSNQPEAPPAPAEPKATKSAKGK